MRDSSFSSFLTDASNQRAYDLCLAVARCEPVSPVPIVLVAEAGCGKSHLLHAIGHRLRAASPHAAIVFARPDRFVDDLRRLLADPRPIDMARYAVLLIDDIHAFTEETEALAKLVRLFLENDHPVVIASEVHPDRLTDLPTDLRRALRAGQAIVFEPGEAQKDLSVVEARLRAESESAVARLQEHIEHLESGGAEAAEQRALVRKQELDSLQNALAEARDELEDLRGANALLAADAKDVKALRGRVEELERAAVERAERHDPQAEAADASLRKRLEEARIDAQRAREDARAMLARAEGLLGELQRGREAFAAAERETASQRAEIQRFASTIPRALTDESDSVDVEPDSDAPNAAREGSIGALQDAATAIAKLESDETPADADPQQEALVRLQESVVRAHAERDNVKSHLARIREDLDQARRDLDRAREDHAKKLAQRDERIEQLERALLERREELERLMDSQDRMHEDIDAIQADLGEDTRLLERAMGLLGITRDDLRGFDPSVAPLANPDVESDEAPPSESADAEAATSGESDLDAIEEGTESDRPDFGDGLRLVPRTGGTIHHVEELRATGGYLPPLDDDTDNEASKTA